MQMKKTILSLVLLLSYSLGFAHNLLPHCSNPDQLSHNHHELHEHYNGEGSSELDHAHITHNNHKDEGLYDFLLCLLSEVDHHTHDELNTEFTFSKTSKVNLGFLKVKFNAITAEKISVEYFSSFISVQPIDFQHFYYSPRIGHLRHRGPPQVS